MSKSVAQGTPAVVLVSGGLDSATALAAAVRDGFTCHAISFDYGQRHRCELDAAARVARQCGAADHKVVAVNLRAIGGSALTADIDVPKDRSESEIGREDGGQPATYVPARNLIFLSLAAGYAQSLNAWDIFIGVNSVDYSGYPDCRQPFINAFTNAANFAVGARDDNDNAPAKRPGFTVHAPLVSLTKVQIIQLAHQLRVDLALTHSCYDPDESGVACGRCDSCLIRRKGFEAAGIPDPTRYQAADARGGGGARR